MKRFIAAFLSIIIFFVLQTTVIKWIAFGGIVPNILIILTATCGMTRGEKEGLWVGFFCGLLCDIFFGSFIGLNAILYMYLGYLNGKFHQVFYPDDIKLPLILIITSDLLYSLSFYTIMFLLRGRFDFSYYFLNIILPELVYTIFASLFIYPILLFIHKKLDKITNNRGIGFAG